MLLAGAALFVPHAGKPIRPRPAAPLADTRAHTPAAHEPIGLVTTHEDFRVPPDHAFDDFIHEAADKYRVAPALIRAIIRTESSFDATAVSSAGARGLMQLMPTLAADLGVSDSFDPRQNIMAGTRYLSSLLADHDGDLELALASYNAGPGNVERYNGIPPFKETQRYVRTITRLLEDSSE